MAKINPCRICDYGDVKGAIFHVGQLKVTPMYVHCKIRGYIPFKKMGCWGEEYWCNCTFPFFNFKTEEDYKGFVELWNVTSKQS